MAANASYPYPDVHINIKIYIYIQNTAIHMYVLLTNNTVRYIMNL